MIKLQDYTVYKDTLIINALKKIDSNKQGFVIVVDDESKVIGVLTDGDIRRGIIAGKAISGAVSDFYTKDATTVDISDGLDVIIELFKNERIKFIPITDSHGILKNIITDM